MRKTKQSTLPLHTEIQADLKIVQVTSSLLRERGGPPQVTINVARHLQSRGFDVHIIVCGQRETTFGEHKVGEYLDIAKVSVFFSRRDSIYGKLLNIRELKKFRRFLLDADVIILHQVYNYQNLAAFWICKKYGKKFLLMPHGTLTNYQRAQHRGRKFFANILFNKLVTGAASILVATEIEKNQIRSKFETRVDKVGIGIKLDSKYRVEEKTKICRNFLFLGRISEKKRIDVTIKAFALFLADFPDAELTIAGAGDYKLLSKLNALVSSLEISSNVKFVSWVSGEDKNKLYQKTDYFVLNSEDENFAIAVAEAQSYGIPVLISRFVAYSEIVADYNSGVIIESLDAEAVASGMRIINEANYANLSRNSLQSAKSVSWNLVIEKWVSVIQEMRCK